jgi:MFS family permease
MTSSRLIPLIIASALFMENMDSTVIATSLPAMAKDLGTDPIVLKLAFTTYLLSLTVFIPVSGWMADRFGARHVFRVAIAVFTLGSSACGLATSLGELVAARGLQGVEESRLDHLLYRFFRQVMQFGRVLRALSQAGHHLPCPIPQCLLQCAALEFLRVPGTGDGGVHGRAPW